MSKVIVELANRDDVELRLTITMPVHAWDRVRRGENWNPFRDAIHAALLRVDSLAASEALEP